MPSGRRDLSEQIEKIIDGIYDPDTLPYLDTESIPHIDLYMDQVTTFMENNLGFARRNEDDKILTRTMINNYTKNKLLPPSDKKRYSKEHLVIMSLIYSLKGFLSLQDIQAILSPLIQRFFQRSDAPDIEEIYQRISHNHMDDLPSLKENILELSRQALADFSDSPPQDQDFLRYFSLICLLSFDVYMKKRTIEKLIDEIHF